MRTPFALLVLLLEAIPSDAQACPIRWQSKDELKAEARVVVEAVVLARDDGAPSFRGVDYRYRVRIDSVTRGSFPKGEVVVPFEDLQMHRRGGMTVCPLKHGSGIEHKLEPGRRYELFLRSVEDPEVLLAVE